MHSISLGLPPPPTQKTKSILPIQTTPHNLIHKRISVIVERGVILLIVVCQTPCDRDYVLSKLFMVLGECPKCVDMSN